MNINEKNSCLLCHNQKASAILFTLIKHIVGPSLENTNGLSVLRFIILTVYKILDIKLFQIHFID